MNIKLDPRQSVLLEELKKIATSLNQPKLQWRYRVNRHCESLKEGCGNLKNNKFCAIFIILYEIAASVLTYLLAMTNHATKPLQNGVYLYGSVGTGKTMLMELFYNLIHKDKLMIHYQNLMKSVHEDIYKFQSNYKLSNNIIAKVAKEYSNRAKIICIDEFEIKDITDAMIIGTLLTELAKQKIFVFITSNTIPSNLYKDGLQREAFLPVIDKINKDFYVVCLDGSHDYRMDKLKQQVHERIIYPLTEENKLKMQQIILNIIGKNNFLKQSIEILGRQVAFERVNKKTLITNFEELFTRDLSYIDYINICQRFNVIIVENIQIISPDNTNLIVRFINFIDNAYFCKVLLFMSLEVTPKEIYRGGIRAEEFKRTVSRLEEMKTEDYLKS